MDSLPSLVLGKLLESLDKKTKKTARLVCRKWNNKLERQGLCVQINENIDENLDFVRSICFKEAKILHFQNPETVKLFRDPCMLEKMTLAGPIEPRWFKQSLLIECKYLTKLVISHECTSSCDLYSLQVKEWNSELQQIVMEHLTSLIILGRNNDRHYSSKRGQAEKNLNYVLSCIQCPQLKILKLSIYPWGEDEMGNYSSWRSSPLRNFLFHNRFTLRELYLPDNQSLQWGSGIATELQNAIMSDHLKVLNICLEFQRRHRFVIQNHEFWIQNILAQCDLEVVCIICRYISFSEILSSAIPSLLTSITEKNHSSLKHILLTFNFYPFSIIDGAIFTKCCNLITLRLDGNIATNLWIDNLNLLPTSLKVLGLRYVQTSFEKALNANFKQFKNLEFLRIGPIMNEENKSKESTRNLKALLKVLLQLRRISNFQIRIKKFVKFDLNLKQILTLLLTNQQKGPVDTKGCMKIQIGIVPDDDMSFSHFSSEMKNMMNYNFWNNISDRKKIEQRYAQGLLSISSDVGVQLFVTKVDDEEDTSVYPVIQGQTRRRGLSGFFLNGSDN